MRPDALMLVAILIVMALATLLFALFFAFVWLDEKETSGAWFPWDVDELCDGCHDRPAVVAKKCGACERRTIP